MARPRGPGQHRAAAEGRRAAGAVGEHNRVGGRGLRPAGTRPGQRAVPGRRGGRRAAGRGGGRCSACTCRPGGAATSTRRCRRPGCAAGTLRRAVLTEMALVLGFGVIIGIGDRPARRGAGAAHACPSSDQRRPCGAVLRSSRGAAGRCCSGWRSCCWRRRGRPSAAADPRRQPGPAAGDTGMSEPPVTQDPGPARQSVTATARSWCAARAWSRCTATLARRSPRCAGWISPWPRETRSRCSARRGPGSPRCCGCWPGLLRPTAGLVEVCGRRVGDLTGRSAADMRLRDVGVVLQNPGRNLLHNETALGNVLFAQGPTRRVPGGQAAPGRGPAGRGGAGPGRPAARGPALRRGAATARPRGRAGQRAAAAAGRRADQPARPRNRRGGRRPDPRRPTRTWAPPWSW